MSNIVTVLHISDLHRSSEHPVGNKALINSLERDLERYTGDGSISKPDLIVVSGDIVMGVKGDSVDDLTRLKEQYDEALEFLTEMASVFFEGNKNRIILVPGNHDVNRFFTKNSMTVIIPEGSEEEQLRAKRDLRRLMHTGPIRWSWNTFEFYRITVPDLYNKRFEAFSDFYSAFYDGKRKFSLEPSTQYEIFDFPELEVVIVGFNSCCGIDHCNFIGKIHPDCLADVSRTIRKPEFRNRLSIAVWHHNTSGGPTQSDYMDGRILQNLIDSNLSFGLHGHQHKMEVLHHQFNLDASRRIVVLSAGSLCAGAEELPGGMTRQYNIYEIDKSTQKAKIHIREAIEAISECPIWRPKTLGSFSGIPKEVEFNLPDSQLLSEEEVKLDQNKKLSKATDLITNYDFEAAMEILESMDFEDENVRYLLLECYVELDKHDKVAERYFQPKSSREAVILMESLWELKESSMLKELLESEFVKNSVDPSIKLASRKYVRRV